MGPERWQALAAKTAGGADGFHPGLRRLIEDELRMLLSRWPSFEAAKVPAGAIHADLFPDNVFFLEGQLRMTVKIAPPGRQLAGQRLGLWDEVNGHDGFLRGQEASVKVPTFRKGYCSAVGAGHFA